MADSYADFTRTRVWYRMYCVGKMGSKKDDYREGFESLQKAYHDLFDDYGDPPESISRLIEPIFKKISTILKARRFGETQINQIANLLWEFEGTESQFRERFLEYRETEDGKSTYEDELLTAVTPLLKAEQYDAMVVEAFKFIDKRLQNILQVSPHEYHGESLINLAFAPNDGKLQLNADPNEQKGLRNFFSGANALFRNPAAHRSLFKGENVLLPHFSQDHTTAMAVVVLVQIMEEIICNLATKSIDQAVRNALLKVACKNSWSEEIENTKESWFCSKFRVTKMFWNDYRMGVVFHYEKQDSTRLSIHLDESVSVEDGEELARDIETSTGYRIEIIRR